MKNVDFSVVMPCLNEEKTLGSCIRKAHEFFQNYIFKEVFDICRKYNNNFNNTA